MSDIPSTQPVPPQENSEYPEQRHAGAVGLGPEYGKGASGSDKITGWKEEIEGKVLRNPAKLQHGKDLRTGELKKREQAEEDENPFASGGGTKGKAKHSDSKQSPSEVKSTPPPPAAIHHDERGEKEQAATVAPEGTNEAEEQRKGGQSTKNKQIG
ncbi:hypothetical protein C8Q75DRAFT_786618 [Abortiporus biennis]|nr:hypothetical protein C8Q75DRAFT_786618 [Abortiporus biennis]